MGFPLGTRVSFPFAKNILLEEILNARFSLIINEYVNIYALKWTLNGMPSYPGKVPAGCPVFPGFVPDSLRVQHQHFLFVGL